MASGYGFSFADEAWINGGCGKNNIIMRDLEHDSPSANAYDLDNISGEADGTLAAVRPRTTTPATVLLRRNESVGGPDGGLAAPLDQDVGVDLRLADGLKKRG